MLEAETPGRDRARRLSMGSLYVSTAAGQCDWVRRSRARLAVGRSHKRLRAARQLPQFGRDGVGPIGERPLPGVLDYTVSYTNAGAWR